MHDFVLHADQHATLPYILILSPMCVSVALFMFQRGFNHPYNKIV